MPKCLGAEVTCAEVSSGHFGTGAEVSWYRSVLGPKCPVTRIRTRDLLITSPTLYRYTTSPPSSNETDRKYRITLAKPSLEVAPTTLRLVCYLFTVFTSDLLFLHVVRSGFSQFHSNLQPKKQHLSCDPEQRPVTLTYKLDLVSPS